MPAEPADNTSCFSRREPLAEYLARLDYVSSSALRRFLRTGRSPAQAMIPDPTPREASLGDALHALMLEPERFDEDYLPLDTASPPPTGLDQAAVTARTWLSADESMALKAMRRAVLGYARLPLATWLAQGEKELSIYWGDALGGRWKGRPDCFTDEVILELKTASDVRPARFAKARRRFGYDLQAALYLEGVARLTGRRPRFLYVAVESVRPHTVWLHEPAAAELEVAQRTLDDARERFRHALAMPAEDPKHER
jgi:hypothetical protein